MKNTIKAEHLEAALKQARYENADLADARVRKAQLEAEVNEWLEKNDPRNEESLRLIQGKRTQLDLLPGFIERAERKQRSETVPKLKEAIESTHALFNAELNRAREEAIDRFEKLIKPWNPEVTEFNGAVAKPARRIAQSFTVLSRFDVLLQRWPGSPNWGMVELGTAIEIAEAALGLVNEVNREGFVAGIKLP